MKKPSGVILYQGPSLLDGAPIVVIATGLENSSNNKTGNMIQTHILCADMLPVAAIQEGKDSSICGDCVHRGDGTGKGVHVTSVSIKRRLPCIRRSCVAVTQCTTQQCMISTWRAEPLGSDLMVTPLQHQ